MDRCPHCDKYDMNLAERGYCIHCLKDVRPPRREEDPDPPPSEAVRPSLPEPAATAPAAPASASSLSRPLTTSVGRLDPQSLQYLHEIDRSSGQGHCGVFVRRPTPSFSGPRGGWWFHLSLGLVLLAVLAYVCLLVAAQRPGEDGWAVLEAILAAFGVLFLLVGLARFLRPAPAWPLRNFLYADAMYLWDVSPGHVEAAPLSELQSADGTHRFLNGAYSRSEIALTFPPGKRTWLVPGKAQAERLFQFCQWLCGLRNSQHAHVRAWAAAVEPGKLAATVCHLLEHGDNADVSNLPPAPDPPNPHLVPPDPAAVPPGASGVFARLACAAAVGAAGYFAFPLLNAYFQDEYLFAQVPAPDRDGVPQLESYLNTFPNGRHAAAARDMRDEQLFARIPARDDGSLAEINHYLERVPDGHHTAAVRDLRDDRGFSRADREARTNNSPGKLRDYLADKANQRHRPEAQRLIAGFYDRTIEDLKKKQAKAGPTDQEIFEAVFALLEMLKSADRPVVTVGFTATIDAEPKTAIQKEVERQTYEARLNDTPGLKAVADRQPNHSAILTCGQVFDPEQTARRESVILNRLRDAVQKGINADILTLEPVAKGESPMLEVGYHTYAGGRLGVYTGEHQEVLGLVRFYETNWVITVRSLGERKEASFKLTSAPAPRLTYDPRDSDPSWAPYAIILYSGFYDMSASLIRSFGLDPGPAPNAFTFDAVASNKPDEPDKPFGVPGWPPNVPPQPKFPFPDK